MEPKDFPVNLVSREDIQAKLPDARKILKAKQEALRELQRDVENWIVLISLLARLAGETDTEEIPGPTTVREGAPEGGRSQPRVSRKESPAQDRAIAALGRAGKPMGPTALYRFMQSQDLQLPKNPNALGAALWNAMESGRVKKTRDGLYALPEWQTDQPELQDAPQNGSAPSVEPTVGEQASTNPGVLPGDSEGRNDRPHDEPASSSSWGPPIGEGSAKAASRF